MSLYAIYVVLTATVPWIINGIWNTSSLAECREVLQGQVGACFSVLTERWHQLIFGRYPIDSYWRPTLAFLLMFVAIAQGVVRHLKDNAAGAFDVSVTQDDTPLVSSDGTTSTSNWLPSALFSQPQSGCSWLCSS